MMMARTMHRTRTAEFASLPKTSTFTQEDGFASEPFKSKVPFQKIRQSEVIATGVFPCSSLLLVSDGSDLKLHLEASRDSRDLNCSTPVIEPY